MSDPAFRDERLTVDDYLRREESARVRHEYVGGLVYAMTGGTLRHNKIALNIAARLRAASAGGPCQVFMNDVKVRAGDNLFYYPDVVVACGPVDDDDVFLRDPCLIVEVTSPSTKATDRREKLLAYQTIDTLRAYLIVDHRRRRVEMHAHDAAGTWLRAEITGNGTVSVPCPTTTLSLDAIYEGVTLPVVSERAPAGYGA